MSDTAHRNTGTDSDRLDTTQPTWVWADQSAVWRLQPALCTTELPFSCPQLHPCVTHLAHIQCVIGDVVLPVSQLGIARQDNICAFTIRVWQQHQQATHESARALFQAAGTTPKDEMPPCLTKCVTAQFWGSCDDATAAATSTACCRHTAQVEQGGHQSTHSPVPAKSLSLRCPVALATSLGAASVILRKDPDPGNRGVAGFGAVE